MGLSRLQKQVLEDLGMNMAKSMDFEILCATMVNSGWTVLNIDYNPVEGQGWDDVVNWAGENFEGHFQEHAGTWLIKNVKDATMFALKWKLNND